MKRRLGGWPWVAGQRCWRWCCLVVGANDNNDWSVRQEDRFQFYIAVYLAVSLGMSLSEDELVLCM